MKHVGSFSSSEAEYNLYSFTLSTLPLEELSPSRRSGLLAGRGKVRKQSRTQRKKLALLLLLVQYFR